MNTNSDNLRVMVERPPWGMGEIRFLVMQRSVRGGAVVSQSVACPLTLKAITAENEGEQLEPTFTMYPQDAQFLMDELWRVGLRPSEGAGSAGQMAATERHLEDMRTLVFAGSENKKGTKSHE